MQRSSNSQSQSRKSNSQFSLRQLPQLDLILIVLVTAICVVASLRLPEASLLRLPFGLPLSLVLPGLAVTAAAFPGRSFSRAERVLFTFGLSLALAILSGVALNWTPWGLTTTSISLLLGGTVLIACAIAFIRRLNMAPWEHVADRAAIEEMTNGNPTMRFSPLQWLTFGLAGIITAGALISAVVEAKRNPANDVLQMWMVPVEAKDLPTNTVRIGVRNFEYANSQYRLQLMRGGYVVQEWAQLNVEPGNTWEITMTLQSTWPGNGPVEAILYQSNEPREAFRKTSYWLQP